MQIIYGTKRLDINNDESAIATILKMVDDIIQEEATVFSHLVVDGIEIYDNHEAYLEREISNILEVRVVSSSKKEMIWNTMLSINDYLDRAVPALQDLIEKSYGGFTNETWEGINQLAEGMQWILQFRTFTNGYNEKPANWHEVEESIISCENHFKQLITGIETQDTILISDILLYEIVPAYEELNKNLAKSLENKEFLNHAH